MTTLLDTDNGRARRILPWIIEQADTDETAAFRVTSMSTLHAQLWEAIHDPVKLAQVIGEEGWRLGWRIYDSDPGDSLLLPCLVIAPDEDNETIFIEPFRNWADCKADPHYIEVSMPEARTLLTSLLPIPDGAIFQTERLFRSE